ASLAIHWRGLMDNQIKTMRESVSTCWKPIAAKGGLELHPFNGGLELRCPGRDKGTAINAILAESEPEEPIAFLGDDLTDEDGFAMLRGRGLGVLVSNESRETFADLQIRPPESLLDFLSIWHDKAPARSAQISGERA
ncbi:MAG: hypothetical protein IBX47_09280, partial [Desulfuromonadales bacterium]|nr:hypothetical protein [Desulfuromonadales bacterium]